MIVKFVYEFIRVSIRAYYGEKFNQLTNYFLFNSVVVVFVHEVCDLWLLEETHKLFLSDFIETLDGGKEVVWVLTYQCVAQIVWVVNLFVEDLPYCILVLFAFAVNILLHVFPNLH